MRSPLLLLPLILFHPANNDGIPPQQHSPGKRPSSFVSRGLSTALPLSHRSSVPLRTHQDRWLHILRLGPKWSCRPGICKNWLAASFIKFERPHGQATQFSHRLRFARTPQYKHHLGAEYGSPRMSLSAGVSKLSSSGQRQLTFSQIIRPSERTLLSDCVRVMSRPPREKRVRSTMTGALKRKSSRYLTAVVRVNM